MSSSDFGLVRLITIAPVTTSHSTFLIITIKPLATLQVRSKLYCIVREGGGMLFWSSLLTVLLSVYLQAEEMYRRGNVQRR